MNSYGIQGPVPLYELGWETKSIGALGNSPTPLSFASMSAADAAYLFFRAATIEKRVEFTPLTDGPGELIDYSGAQGWDGTKAITTQAIAMWDPLLPPMAWGPVYADSAAARNGIRDYDVATWEPPADPADNLAQYGAAGAPGYWIGIGTDDIGGSAVDGSMRYNITGDWSTMSAAFSAGVAAQLAAWAQRLEGWLGAEEAKDPQNLALIAEIERQQSAQAALEEQITFQADNAIAKIEEIRALYTDQNNANKVGANYIAKETEAFALWIAAEEELEAFSALRYPLESLRQSFREYIQFKFSHRWLGWQRAFEPGIGILGARIATANITALDSNNLPVIVSTAIPALATVDLAFSLGFPLQEITDLPQTAVDACASVFELTTPPYTMSISSLQVESTIKTAIGPVSFGLTPQACDLGSASVLDIPSRIPAVRVIGGGLLSGMDAGGCPVENPDCDPYIIGFYEVFDSTGQPIALNTTRAANANGDKEWAFQSPYASIAGNTANVTTLQAFWQQVATLIEDRSESPTTPAEQCGIFRIEAADGRVMLEQPLYTQAGVVGGVSIIFKVLTVRP